MDIYMLNTRNITKCHKLIFFRHFLLLSYFRAALQAGFPHVTWRSPTFGGGANWISQLGHFFILTLL